MTDYTPEQIQAMRDWLAVILMGWVTRAESNWYWKDGLRVILISDFKPDQSGNQRDAMMDTFDRTIIRQLSSGKFDCEIWVKPEDSWSSATSLEETRGMACLIAACRASGMEGI